MSPRNALLLLAAGALLGTALALYDVPAGAIAGWALCLVAANVLAKATVEVPGEGDVPVSTSFKRAELFAVLGVAGGALELAGVDSLAVDVLPVAAILGVTVGCAGGLRAVLEASWRSAAALRLTRALQVVGGVLALLVVLDAAGVGPSWTATGARVVSVAMLLVVAWFAAFCVASRDALRA